MGTNAALAVFPENCYDTIKYSGHKGETAVNDLEQNVMQAKEDENALADRLRAGLASMGYSFFGSSPTNQVFPILPAGMVKALEKDFFFYEWGPEQDGWIPIRLVTGWGTSKSDVEAFLNAVRSFGCR